MSILQKTKKVSEHEKVSEHVILKYKKVSLYKRKRQVCPVDVVSTK